VRADVPIEVRKGVMITQVLKPRDMLPIHLPISSERPVCSAAPTVVFVGN